MSNSFTPKELVEALNTKAQFYSGEHEDAYHIKRTAEWQWAGDTVWEFPGLFTLFLRREDVGIFEQDFSKRQNLAKFIPNGDCPYRVVELIKDVTGWNIG